MPTKISYQTWSGGSGIGDNVILLGYCVESPIEVLKKVYQKYHIYHYKDLYRPVDYNFPNNCSGLIIKEVTDSAISIPGCTITGSVDQLDLSKAYNENLKRDIEIYKHGIEMADKCHTYSKEEINKKYKAQIEEVKSVILVEN